MENKFFVSVQGEHVIIMVPPTGRLTKEDALGLAAWLFVMSGASDDARDKAIMAVENT